jgi:hypothetical protein
MSLFDTTWSIQVEKLLPPVLRSKDFAELDDDFKAGTADNEYIGYIVLSSPGHWKEFPTIGVGIWNYLQGTASPQVLQRAILKQLEGDIFTKPQVDIRRFPTITINRVTISLDGE